MAVDCIVLGGKGAVGSALVKILEAQFSVGIVDLASEDTVRGSCKFLHVAIPYSPAFVAQVKAFADLFHAEHIIVHSTVPVGTTSQIPGAVHSPVLGKHDALFQSLLRFRKYVGGDDPEAELHLQACFKLCHLPKPEDTELLKLLELMRFLNDLAFYEWTDGMLYENGTPRDAYLAFVEDYNSGYLHTQFQVPELYFPDGKVGGSCVMQATKHLPPDPFIERMIAVFEKQTVPVESCS